MTQPAYVTLAGAYARAIRAGEHNRASGVETQRKPVDHGASASLQDEIFSNELHGSSSSVWQNALAKRWENPARWACKRAGLGPDAPAYTARLPKSPAYQLKRVASHGCQGTGGKVDDQRPLQAVEGELKETNFEGRAAGVAG